MDAKPQCKKCHGSGEVPEYHGPGLTEMLACDDCTPTPDAGSREQLDTLLDELEGTVAALTDEESGLQSADIARADEERVDIRRKIHTLLALRQREAK